MSVEAPWLDAPAVDDAEPWKSAPVVENADAPWESAPIVEDAQKAAPAGSPDRYQERGTSKAREAEIAKRSPKVQALMDQRAKDAARGSDVMDVLGLKGSFLDQSPESLAAMDVTGAARAGIDAQAASGINPGKISVQPLIDAVTIHPSETQRIDPSIPTTPGGEEDKPIITLPTPSADTVAAGIARGLSTAASGLTTPVNLGLLAAGAGAPAVAQKIAAGVFATTMAKDIPGQVSAAMDAKSPGEAAERITEAVTTGAMALLAGKHALGRAPMAAGDRAVVASDAQLAREQERIQAGETLPAMPAGEGAPVAELGNSAPAANPAESVKDNLAVDAEQVLTEPVTEQLRAIWPGLSERETKSALEGPFNDSLRKKYDALPDEKKKELDAWFDSNEGAITKHLDAEWFKSRTEELERFAKDGDATQFAARMIDGLREINGRYSPKDRQAAASQFFEESGNIANAHGLDPKAIEGAARSEMGSIYGADAPEMSEALFGGIRKSASNKAKPLADTPPVDTPVEAAKTEPVAEKPAEPEANDWTQATIPELKTEPAVTPKDTAGATLGAVPQGFTQLVKATDMLKAGAQKVVSAIKDIPKFHDFRKSVLNWSARNQASTGEILKAAKDITASVPDKTRREAITNWIQAGGDTAELANRAAASTDLKLKKGYQAALTLTPAEQALAGKIRQTYDILLKRANDAGIQVSEIENYVNQIWKRQPLKEFAASSNRKLSTSIRFAKQRYYDSFFHGEQSGLKPETKDIAKLLPIYMNEVNNAISAKRFVAEMAKGKASDGRPLLAPRGGAKVIEGDEGGKVQLVFPEKATKDTGDYKVLEQPALHGWKWVGTDEAGVSTMAFGDLAVHPEAFGHLKDVLGQSAIREWYRSPSENIIGDIPKAAAKFLLDDVQQIAKATMLGFLSPFHQVQEGTHAIGHKVNPFGGIPKIDLTEPKQLDAAQHGLMLLPDRVSANQFREGLDGSTRNIAANLIGMAGKPGAIIKEWADGYQNYLFHQYIPGLKLKTYDHILERNTKRYVDELASGEVTLDQVKYLSAQQSNAAYGHLNYADIGRNPTLQHLAQVFLLAPDFLEARTRFALQAGKGAVTKAGREQLAAILTLAVTQYVAARALNKIADDDPHWNEPFGVIAGNRKYTMRSVPEDIYKATTDMRKFVSGRLSPIVGRGLLEGLSGVNYRGEPTTAAETFTNILAGSVPLTLQPATRGLSETGKDNPVSPIEQLIGSLGLHVSRFSPVSEIYHLSKDWTEKHGKEYGLDQRRAVFPVSKYQQLRYALEDSDNEKAQKEITDLLASEKITRGELASRFQMSINHPFTGTTKTDEIFKKSLDERGKKVFDAAMKRRALLIERFKAVK